MELSKGQQKLHNENRDRILQFYRNARWGTCGDCPRDSQGKAYPEFCSYTKRHDHHLTVDQLASNWKINLGF